MTGCDNSQREAVEKVHSEAVERCKVKWADKPRVPLRALGYTLDATRLSWGMDFGLWSNDENCGAATIDSIFFWDGEKIMPEYVGFWVAGRRLIQPSGIKDKWVLIQLRGMMGGNPDRVRECRANPEACRFPPGQHEKWPSGEPKEWPPELVVRLKNYPDFEVRIRKQSELDQLRPTDRSHHLGFIFKDWPRENGHPRIMYCDLGRDVLNLTREEIENLDFTNQQGNCQLEYGDFTFNGGSARAVANLQWLHRLTPALRALRQYMNESITKDQP